MQALLEIVEHVHTNASGVTIQQVDKEKKAGTDEETIHDNVLCMFNRYEDGLITFEIKWGTENYIHTK